jgi:hypothetical protein
VVAAAAAVEADKVQAEEIAAKSRAAATAAATAAAAVAAAMPPVPALDAVVPVRLLELPDAPLGAGVSAGAEEVAAGEEAAEAGEQRRLVPA